MSTFNVFRYAGQILIRLLDLPAFTDRGKSKDLAYHNGFCS
jgi:hypothetical protein